MNSMDSAAAQAVWQRVRQSHSMSERDETLESALPRMIEQEREARCTYLALARCAGRNAGVFRCIAEEEGRHARKLAALYYLLTGNEHCPKVSGPVCVGNLCEELRARYAAELSAAQFYREAAERWPEQGNLFRCLAAAEQCHSERLRTVAEQLIGC